jgi:histidinol-phosphate aminotransferase
VPAFRPDLADIPLYKPGKPIEEVAHELGLPDIVKLASNECPTEPFPNVVEAIGRAAAGINRYPETTSQQVRNALGLHFGASPDHFMIGAGSSQLLGCTTLATGGPGTSVVFAEPSFIMYLIGALVSGTTPIQVPVTDGYDHDLDAMMRAIRGDTRVVYICNPNNPTGNHLPADAVIRFIDDVPDEVLVVVDEAYAEYVTAPDFATALPLALERSNVIVSRTFSKIYGLSGLRIGYFVGDPHTLDQLRRVQPPFSVTALAQAAAVEALRHEHLVAERAKTNAAGREWLTAELENRGVPVVPSQANFIAVAPDDPPRIERDLLSRGVIVRRLGSLIRITVGTEQENARFIAAWDDIT